MVIKLSRESLSRRRFLRMYSVWRLVCGGYQILDEVAISLPDATVNLVLSLRGGKGGFGSLLRGAATKAGAKKTNNFDACRDMSGRRLRHVNAEKKLEEWKAGEEERKLEKLAQEFLKKQAIKGKQGVGNGATQKYVKKYREESAKCIEAVELALKESFQNGKKKGKKIDADSEKSKRLKIWMGKRTVEDSDSDDNSSDEEDEKSAFICNGSQFYSNKSSDPTMAEPLDSSKSCYEEEKDIIVHQSSDVEITNAQLDNTEEQTDHRPVNQTEKKENPIKLVSINNETIDSDTTNITNTSFGSKSDEPLNLDNFSTASDMEVLGMERLKNELEMKGMKCGGTLKERAQRLFLLKSTPLEKIPKKLMAAKK